MTEHQTRYQKKPFNWRWFLSAAAIVFVIFLGAAYAWFCPIANPNLYSQFFFRPEKKTDGPWQVRAVAGHAYEDVYFHSKNGSKLHGWYFRVPNSTYTFLVQHGNGGNLASRTGEMELLLGTGSNVLIYDYEGYGLSEGSPSTTNVCNDALSAYQYLRENQRISPDRIIIFGESIGSSISGYLSTKVESAGIVLQSPLASLRRKSAEVAAEVTKNLMQLEFLYPAKMWPESGFDNIKIFESPHQPLLIIVGTRDVSVAHADDLFAAACEKKHLVRIEGAGHTGDPNLYIAPEYATSLKEFVSSLKTTTRETARPKDHNTAEKI